MTYFSDSTLKWDHVMLSFCAWLISLKTTTSGFIHAVASSEVQSFVCGIFPHVYLSHSFYLFTSGWTSMLLIHDYCEYCCIKQEEAVVSSIDGWHFPCIYPVVELLSFVRNCQVFSIMATLAMFPPAVPFFPSPCQPFLYFVMTPNFTRLMR